MMCVCTVYIAHWLEVHVGREFQLGHTNHSRPHTCTSTVYTCTRNKENSIHVHRKGDVHQPGYNPNMNQTNCDSTIHPPHQAIQQLHVHVVLIVLSFLCFFSLSFYTLCSTLCTCDSSIMGTDLSLSGY